MCRCRWKSRKRDEREREVKGIEGKEESRGGDRG